MIVPPPKYHVARLIPGVDVAPSATLAGLMIIQRGGTGEESLPEAEALSILMENCEDAYGFPPYHTIEGFLHSSNGSDLRAMERQCIASAFRGRPSTLLRSSTMDWAERLPAVIDRVSRAQHLRPAEPVPAPQGEREAERPPVRAAVALPLEAIE
jgi:hypothetical protein